MKSRSLRGVFALLCALLAPLILAAQESVTAPAVTAASQVVPNLISYNSILRDSSGRTLTSVTGVTFLLYSAEQADGAELHSVVAGFIGCDVLSFEPKRNSRRLGRQFRSRRWALREW